MPEGLLKNWARFETFTGSAPEVWAFWLRWYEGMLKGQPLDWDLQEKVALIPDEDWEKGPEHIAEKIREIEAEFRETDPLPEDETRTHVQVLLQKALVAETTSSGLERLVQMAIDAYRREISNALPDALGPLEQLPPILDQIALILAGEKPASQKEAELYQLIQKMARTISVLNQRLRSTGDEIEATRETVKEQSGRRLFAEAFYKKAGEGTAGLLTSKVLWGGVIAGGGLLMGPNADALIDTLGQCYQDVIAPEAPSQTPTPWVPPISEA